VSCGNGGRWWRGGRRGDWWNLRCCSDIKIGRVGQSTLSFQYSGITALQPIPVAARSKASVCGRPPDGIVGSNPAEDMDVCVL
jgi:hypothetical protein